MWRAYLAYRAESATRIQRFWRKKRTGAEYLQLRDQGHRVLGGRKERRRMSLLGSRRFLGDYLGINATNGPGAQIRNAAGIGSNEKTIFSCRAEILEAKFGRSSKPSPRIIVVTNSKFYIIAQALVNGQPHISAEKSVPLGAIKFIGASAARDDWFSLGIGSPQEPDPLMNCVFKTELFTQMQRVMPGGFNLKIGDTIEYAKKPGKMQQVKVLKDSQLPVDYYKSGGIHTQPGPNGRPSRLTGNRTAKPRPGAGSRPTPQPPAAVTAAAAIPAAASQGPVTVPHRPVSTQNAHAAVANSISNHTRNASGAGRAPPPPPPPATPARPASPPKILAKVLYDFAAQRENELSIHANEIVEIVQKSTNGWWLAKNQQTEQQAWVPAAYVQEQAPPAPRAPPAPPRAKPTPPQPPAKRPAANRKPAELQQRDSGMSLNTLNGSTGSRSSTPTPSLGRQSGGCSPGSQERHAAGEGG
ncbi:class II myosin [Fusarium falciforme]|nr:class II myosin [Fusarium falciforme]